MLNHLGKILVITGILLIIAGIAVSFFSGRGNFLGRLPGDIYIERENFRFYFPVTTAILLSIVLSVAIYIIRRFFQ